MLVFYVHDTLGLKFHKYRYCGTLMAGESPSIPFLLFLFDVRLTVVLLVNEAPLSFETNCVVKDDATSVDVLV